ncbi:MAG: winged helix-turn-helix domain-containing protein [Candidatus Saccharimonadales bacterium]
MLDVFITSKTRRKIIILFSKYPDYQTHIRGMAKLIHEDAGNIQRELRKLEGVGFLKSRKRSNTKIYSVDQRFPLFKELQSMVLKSQHHK